jgi:hypothetical protein
MGTITSPLISQELTTILQRGDREDQVAALRALSRIGHLPALRVITPFTACADPGLRAEAIKAISGFRRISHEPALVFYYRRLMERLLREDPSYTVRAEAARCLIERHGRADLLLFLRQMLTHQEGDKEGASVRGQAVESVARIGLDYSDFLLEDSLADPNPDVRARAMIALWAVPERQKDLDQPLQALLGNGRTEEREAGLLVVARRHLAPYRDVAAGLLGTADLRLRERDALAYLGAGGWQEPEAGQAVAILLAIFDGPPVANGPALSSDPAGIDAARRDAAEVIPDLPEEGQDAILVAAVKLPDEARQRVGAAFRAHGVFTHLLDDESLAL